MNDPLEQSLKLVLLGLFSTNIYKKVNRWSPNVFNVLVVSIGLFEFCFVPFMYNGVFYFFLFFYLFFFASTAFQSPDPWRR